MKTALVLGGAGFIGGHMARHLVKNGYWVSCVDIKNDFSRIDENGGYEFDGPHSFTTGDLSNRDVVKKIMHNNGEQYDEIYQFAADMGGAGYIFTGDNDANVMHNSATINLNVLDEMVKMKEDKRSNYKNTKIFYSSSACIYPEHNQKDPDNPECSENSAYPANPDSEYGWEKLFSERLYLSYNRNYGIPVRIARYHNIFGPYGTWNGGREKSPAAICRKVAMAENNGQIEIWGDGNQTRSFLYIDECIEATYRLMQSDFTGPVNIGSEEMVTINKLVDIVCNIAEKNLEKVHVDGPTGVRGRNSNNDLIREKLGWDYSMSLQEGLARTYRWINDQVIRNKQNLDN